MLMVSPSLYLGFEDCSLSNFDAMNIRSSPLESRVNVSIRIVEGVPGSWRAELNDFSHLIPLISPFLKTEMYSLNNPFIDNRMCMYFT